MINWNPYPKRKRAMMLSGAGTITLDHAIDTRRLRYLRLRYPSTAEALAGDWRIVGDDIRHVMMEFDGKR